jgi:hypothetical protein
VVESPETVTITAGGTPWWHAIQIVLTPETVNASNGSIEWFVDGASLGQASYSHSSAGNALRMELSNGGTAADFAVSFVPPRLVTVR